MSADLITVSKVEEGTRLIRWMLRHYPMMPNKEFFKICRGGQLRVNSKRCSGNEILRSGDVVRVPPTVTGYAKGEKLKKTENGDLFDASDLELLRKCIVYDDEDIVVFNKPAGLAVQGGTGVRKSVDKMAMAMFPYAKVSLVHRLDKETSGLLVVAKNQKSAQFLASAFQEKTAYKEYLALLNGDITDNAGIIDNYVLKGAVYDAPVRLNDGVGQRAQHAVTEYKILSRVKGCLTWILFSPKTGRTHQLRIHSAKSLGAPIIGDDLYGNEKKLNIALDSLTNGKHLFLFAYKLSFIHPRTHKLLTLKAELPKFMCDIAKLLELNIPD